MRTLLAALLLAVAPLAHAANECDISLRPAATLLLPYFQVDLQPGGTTTIFTITNTTKMPQIAHVTMWTDLGYPVIMFNIFLTGYDVQPINLYDIFVTGFIGSPNGGPSRNTTPGSISLPNDANPHFLPSAATSCNNLPGSIPKDFLPALQKIFTIGQSGSPLRETCDGLSVPHVYAAGYATIDVVATCGTSNVLSASYWDQILDDNVLTGDYEIVDPKNGLATGSPLVHLRAIDGLPSTFYERYAPAPGVDKRQPLPNVAAVRTLSSSVFKTEFLMWAQPLTGANVACADYAKKNRTIGFKEIAVFDEHENSTRSEEWFYVEGGAPPTVPVASMQVGHYLFPAVSSPDAGGWIYLDQRPGQGWVVSRLISGTMTVQLDATAIGNACNPAAAFP